MKTDLKRRNSIKDKLQMNKWNHVASLIFLTALEIPTEEAKQTSNDYVWVLNVNISKGL